MRADPAGELGACDEQPRWELNLCCVSTDTSDRVSSDCDACAAGGGSEGRLRARSAGGASGRPLPGRLLSARGEEPRRSSCRRWCRSCSLLARTGIVRGCASWRRVDSQKLSELQCGSNARRTAVSWTGRPV